MVRGMKDLQVLIIDDHPLFREGLKLLLETLGVVSKVSCCSDGERAIECLQVKPYDVILLDWNLGSDFSGKPLIDALKSIQAMTRIVVVSADDSAQMVRRAIDAGAAGFVPKGASSEALINALTVTTLGGIYLPEGALMKTGAPNLSLSANSVSSARQEVQGAFPALTAQQINVLIQVASGAPNKMIARALDIAEGTVKQHLNAVYKEMAVRNRTEAVYLLASKGLRMFGSHE
jgi:two-component system, NarL family, nitrate/nitrite response regulator NarL